MNVEVLSTARHEAYQAALASHFKDEALTSVWRSANRAYVLARDGAVERTRLGGRPRLQLSAAARAARRRKQVREAVQRYTRRQKA